MNCNITYFKIAKILQLQKLSTQQIKKKLLLDINDPEIIALSIINCWYFKTKNISYVFPDCFSGGGDPAGHCVRGDIRGHDGTRGWLRQAGVQSQGPPQTQDCVETRGRQRDHPARTAVDEIQRYAYLNTKPAACRRRCVKSVWSPLSLLCSGSGFVRGRDAVAGESDEVRDGRLPLHRRQRSAALRQQAHDGPHSLWVAPSSLWYSQRLFAIFSNTRGWTWGQRSAFS